MQDLQPKGLSQHVIEKEYAMTRSHTERLNKPRLIAIGELLIDWAELQSPEAHVYQANPGGAPGNVVCAAQVLGVETGFIGAVGADHFGQMLIDTLEDHSVHTEGIVRTPDVFTTLAFVSVDEEGDRSFSFARKPGADTTLQLNDAHRHLIRDCDALHYGTISLSHEPSAASTRTAVELAQAQGSIVSFDPNIRLPLWPDQEALRAACHWGFEHASLTKISLDDLAFLSPDDPDEAVRQLITTAPIPLVLLTRGREGATLYYRAQGGIESVASEPGPAVHAIDTTGAGDIFTGAFLSQLLRVVRTHADLVQWLQTKPTTALGRIAHFANTVAGQSTTARGGISSIPSLDRMPPRPEL